MRLFIARCEIQFNKGKKPSVTEGASHIDQDFLLSAKAFNDPDGSSDGHNLGSEHSPADRPKAKVTL